MNTLRNFTQPNFIFFMAGCIQGRPFPLTDLIIQPGGASIYNAASMTLEQRMNIGLFEVVEVIPDQFDGNYQTAEEILTVNDTTVTLSYVVSDIPLATMQNKGMELAYARCKAFLDNQSTGYSMVEISYFPTITKEVLTYMSSPEGAKVIGPMMASIIARGRHTLDSLAASVYTKFVESQQSLTARDTGIVAMNALTTPALVSEFIQANLV